MSEIYSIYNQFLAVFPDSAQWIVSLVLAGLLVITVLQVVKRNFIWLIVLILLLPASVPILTNVWDGVVELIKYLITRK